MRMSRYGKFVMLNNARASANGASNNAEGNNAEARFRDRRGREHYDNGRYAPRNSMADYGDYGQPRGDVSNNGGYAPPYPRMENGSGGAARMGGGEMNVIGFERPQEMRSDYSMDAHYKSGNEMERGKGEKMHGGAHSEGGNFTQDMAKDWVKRMRGADGSTGEHWSMEQIKKLASQRGAKKEAHELYAIMNALHSDYGTVLRKYGVEAPEAYLELAEAWLNDVDAVEDKLMLYYKCIVRH